MSDQRDPIKVRVGMGYTVNMGDFESLRIDISVEDSQQPGEGAKEAHERVFNFVNRRLQEKVTIVRQEQESAGGY